MTILLCKNRLHADRCHSREKMLGHVARWKAGSLTKRAYFQRSGIDSNQFHYWFRVSKRMIGKVSNSKPVFLPIRVKGVPSTATAIQEITIIGASGLLALFQVSEDAIVLIRQLLNG